MAALILAVSLGACKDDNSGGRVVLCGDDDDCSGGVCVDGQCEARQDGTDDTTPDADAEDGLEDGDGQSDGDADADTGDGDGTVDTDPCDADADRPFGCSCEKSVDCASGQCIFSGSGGVCSKRCDGNADCIPEEDVENDEKFSCQSQNTGGDTTNLCVPLFAELCRPCAGQDQCSSAALCYDFADLNEQNCLVTCQTATDCPDEFSCEALGANNETFCYPTLNTCAACYDADGDGAGEGDCIALDCDDEDPSVFFGAEEVCDGKDNNCDGEEDEPFRDPDTGIYVATSHCGVCGNDCSAKPNVIEGACTSEGVCGPAVQCEPGFYDIDGIGTNGCEYECTPKADVTDDSICDGRDDDCDGQIDEDVDFASDDQNCGNCGVVCGAAGVGGGSNTVCVESQCILSSCNEPFEDCNQDASDFCEANLHGVDNCGGCGIVCSDNNTNAPPTCEASTVDGDEDVFACVFDCATNFGNCDDQPGNGCESNFMNDPENCGGCGIRCDYANGDGVCVQGVCKLDSCTPGFEDCNQDGAQTPANSDGCEADLSSVDTCGTCETTCDDTGTDRPPECDGNVDDGFECELRCINRETADCDGDPNNGCESDLLGDLGHCGACGNSCALPNATSQCVSGICLVGSCEGKFKDCDQSLGAPGTFFPPNTSNNGCELYAADDVDNCGGCGNLDPTRFDCDYGGGQWRCEDTTCISDVCPPPTANCNGNPSTCEANLGDVETCGSCQVNCNFPPEAGSNPRIDQAACNPAGSSFTCSIDSCNAGYGNCDSTWSNGCETDFSADTTCGTECGSLVNCVTALDHAVGVCGANNLCEVDTCKAPWADCNSDDTDGCEVNTDISVPHCGGCGLACEIPNAITECTGGGCGFVQCEPGYYDIDGLLLNGCEYACSGNPNAYDLPDDNFVDANCDGFDGDLARAIFVSVTGTNNPTCSRSQPCRDISHALQRASALNKRQILVGATTGSQKYSERITLLNGVDIVGGYPVDNFDSRDLGVRPTIEATSAVGGRVIAASGSNILSATHLYQLRIVAGDAPSAVAGASSYGLHCVNCGGLVVDSSVIVAGNGTHGTPGANGSPPSSSGGTGGTGDKGENDGGSWGAGGTGGASPCNREGGRGGNGSGGTGQRGTNGKVSGAGGGNGGSGGGSGDPGKPGSSGSKGDNGNAGSGGDYGNLVTIDSAGYWMGEGGDVGASGTSGHGGGGGGGGGGQKCTFCQNGAGAGGGGGGGGGCGGTAGVGGTAGGGSFATFFVNSSGTVLRDVELSAGHGGDGGRGGTGGDGSSGGSGGFGGTTDEVGNGGRGGNGGSGGRGGGGGGGRGGDVVCVAEASGSNVTQLNVNCSSLGTAGQGGAGGNNASSGLPGVRKSTEQY